MQMEFQLQQYPKEIGLPFDVILMANMTKERHIEQLKSAGCVYARIAFESANDYIRNAMLGRKLGKRLVMVVEKIEELAQVLSIAKQMGVEPWIGARVRLATKGSGTQP